MKPQTGLILRLLGPMLELACAWGLSRVHGRGITVARLPAEWLLFAGLALGLAMVVAGLTLVRRTARSKPPRLDD